MKHRFKIILCTVLISASLYSANVILIPVSVGELVDKITILEIKMQNMSKPEHLARIHQEWAKLSAILAEKVIFTDEFKQLKLQLFSINKALWDIENDLRAQEAASTFDKKFIELARSVYYTNDQRVEVKRDINKLTGSHITETKEYTKY